MDLDAIGREVDRNYDFFQRHVAQHIAAHRGEFALVRNCEIVGFFNDPGKAAERGASQFADQLFSIQEVTDRPIDLGLYSYAPN